MVISYGKNEGLYWYYNNDDDNLFASYCRLCDGSTF
jgi:hypothetical protein